ncbi:hypothetical protein WN944_014394 [Citrus x changshan-huyou]|uniref:O-methyltransferase C-terminal domain-containing protein n=1 Tax=Citrus x changshan-huyou TaxID=2935761 RepID=A0AAP0QKQ9_9ROSI
MIMFTFGEFLSLYELIKTTSSWSLSEEACVKILKNCYEALPEDGKVIVADCILPVLPDTSLASKHVIQLDCIMLASTTGGREMTEQDFKTLAKAAGFQGFKVVCSAFNTYIMEFLKKP